MFTREPSQSEKMNTAPPWTNKHSYPNLPKVPNIGEQPPADRPLETPGAKTEAISAKGVPSTLPSNSFTKDLRERVFFDREGNGEGRDGFTIDYWSYAN